MKRVLWIGCLLALGAGVARAGDDGGFQQDLDVTAGMRLEIESEAGYALIRAWDQDRVSVQAEHGPRAEVEFRTLGDVILLRPRGWQGRGAIVDLEVRVPEWMPVRLDGRHVDVEAAGLRSELDVELVDGDILVREVQGTIVLRSVQGSIELQGCAGDIDVGSSNEGVFLQDCAGTILAETINGDLRLEGISSSNVEGVTLNGDILYDGSTNADGEYYFATHHGDVEVSVPESADLTITVANVDGDFRSDFDMRPVGTRPGKRLKFVLGEGSGQLRVESFNGDIVLFDPKSGRGKRGR